MGKEISEAIQLMKENKSSNKSLIPSYIMRTLCLIECIGIFAMFSIVLYMVYPTMNENKMISIISLFIAVGAFFVTTIDFVQKGMEIKNSFVIYKYSGNNRIEEFVVKLRNAAEKEKMEIRDIDIFTVKNKVYLKIYY